MKKKNGFLIIIVLVFASIAIAAIIGLVSFTNINIMLARRAVVSEQAFQLAEAGLEYYRWHLAHNQTDFTDGGGAFPHLHDFFDRNGNLIGQYELTITAPITGSTLVGMKSTGIPLANPAVRRTVTSSLGKPSFARYALVSNSDMRFGQGTLVIGPTHSNGGIRFDGVAQNLVTSGVTSYNDPDHTGNNEFGVHTHVNAPPGSGVNDTFRASEAPPTNPVPNRPDVFLAGRRFPVPTVNFAGITADFTNLKSLAQSNGRYFASSTAQGYQVTFNTNDTYTVHRVSNLRSAPNNCTNTAGQTGWGTWTASTTVLIGTYANPNNGVIYMEDHVWVEGQIDTARVTLVAAATSTGVQRSITVNNNLLYTNYDGQDVISLIAENNINTGLYSQDNLRIDAALIANSGRIGRYYYESDCAPNNVRSTITLYGMIGSFLRYGFAYVDNTGYITRNLIYDASLLYAPPPSFPLTTNTYQIVSWQETGND